MAVDFRQEHGHAQGAPARNDGDLVHRVVLGHVQAHDGVPGFVIGGELALLGAHHHGLALGAHQDLVLGLLELLHGDRAAPGPSGQQGRLVDQVGEVGAGESGRAARQGAGRDAVVHRHLAHVHLENQLAAANVGQRNHHLAVEAPGAQKRRVQHIGPVGGGDDDDALAAGEPVHLHQELVQRLLALVVAAAETGAAMAPHGVDLIDEDDAGRLLLGLLEHVAHS